MFDFDEVIDRRAVPALKWHRMVLGQGGEDLFPAGVADMDFRAPPVVRDALQARLEHGILGYETWPAALVPALPRWLATHHGWEVAPEHILRAPNVLNVLSIAISVFSAPGDGVIIQPPVFFDFEDVIHENHREVLHNPLLFENGRYRPDFEGLEKLAARPEARLLFLCNPHNPVGRVWSREELSAIDRICRAHDVLVIADEIHADITFSGHAYTPFASLGPAAAANCISAGR
ncbi:MAG TPA: aminotransferase class I/II-fold pyridoxal phosphate-dependent enzyme, partial [Aliiroseovarius sp.]|nr:aminotransferase class I/II-fold pyridoxal phosphate-dependent enzyme [Aliiroseovarius sp.]